jgi:mannose-6-phosphate isomerase-like protein (cupin superfamily)
MPTREKEEREKGNSYGESTAHDWRRFPSARMIGQAKRFGQRKGRLVRAYRIVRLRSAQMPKHSLPTAAEYQSEPVRYPALTVIDVNSEASAVEQQYKNIVLNQGNTSCLRLAIIQGEYPWHYHTHSDELFFVMEGHLIIDLANGREIRLEPRQGVTIPANTVHRTRAEIRTVNLLFEELAAETVFLETSPR